MSVEIHIVDGPVGPDVRAHDAPRGESGASLIFDGIVRATENGRLLVALEYQAYEPMASRQLAALAEEIVRSHGFLGLACWHSRGRVGVGECSMRVVIRSGHRKEALAGMGEFIDRLKKDVPIWKKPVFAEDRRS